MRSVVSSPAPTSHRRYKVGDCDPSTTIALDRLAVQGAVNVVSTWWAGDGRRRRGRRGRRADAGTHTYYLRARTCTHQQLSSRHPTPAAVAIYTGQGLHTSSGNTVGTTTTLHTTYGSPPYYVSHQHTHPPPLTCGPHCPSPVPAFKSALSRLRFPKCRHDNRSPTAAAAADTAPPPTSLAPTTGTAPLTSTHQPHQHLAPPIPLVHTASARV